MRVLAVPDAPEGERDLESGVTTEPAGPAYVVAVDADGVTVAWSEYPGTAEGGLCLSDDVPDTSDPATLGAMLGVLRRLYDEPAFSVRPYRHSALPGGVKWIVMVGNQQPGWEGATEAEAMVRAAEAWARR